jgi:methyl-accepting chemotaxis protein
MRLLRRTARGARGIGDRSATDDTALWSAHERALVRARDAAAAAQRIASSAATQRGAIDTMSDTARALASRAAEVQSACARIIDAFERMGLIALNAGLEGARLGDAEGKQLVLVSDEVRAQTSRGGDSAREVAAALGQLATELGQLDVHVAEAQAVVAQVAQDSTRAAGAASDAESALLDVGERVKRATGSDPDTVRAVAEASDRARALVASLSALSGKVPRGLLLGALRPVLENVARLLGDDEAATEPDEEAEP